jgi:hypothetical protein
MNVVITGDLRLAPHPDDGQSHALELRQYLETLAVSRRLLLLLTLRQAGLISIV